MPDDFIVTVDHREFSGRAGETILEVCRREGIDVPTLCHQDGLTEVGGCRMCLVELEPSGKLVPACATPSSAGQRIRTDTERLRQYRRLTLEFLFSEGNHVCAVCVANNHCELQSLAVRHGMEHVRVPYLFQKNPLDATHKDFILDRSRCILCTRCVRTCGEVEGAHTWAVKDRGLGSRIIADMDQAWGDSSTCTSCGKCVQSCPTGALWPKDAAQGRLMKNPKVVSDLVKRRKPPWEK